MITCVLCPVCKRPFTEIIYDCHDSSYRVWRIDGSTSIGETGCGFAPTPEHRRRRSVYLSAEGTPKTDLEELAPSHSYITAPLLDRPAVLEWIIRELQAVLLMEDVLLIAQHIVGMLRKSLSSQKAIHRRAPGRIELKQAVAVIAEAAQPYLGEHIEKFAEELTKFISSGLNVAAYDAVVFHLEAEQVQSSDDSGKGVLCRSSS